MTKPLISIVIPMYNEHDVAAECHRRLARVLADHPAYAWELIYVNDGSSDDTLEIVKTIAASDSRVRVIGFARNFGHQIAVTAGIHKAAGDAVAVIDADLQDPPELIPAMAAKWQEGYHVVYGRRQKREGETWFKLVSAKCFYRILNRVTDVAIPLDTGDFRLIDRKVVEVFKNMPEHNRFLRGMISWIGFRQTALLYERQERFAGESKYPLSQMLKLAFDGMLSFSHKPVQWIRQAGMAVTGISKVMFLLWLVFWLAGNAGSLFYTGWQSVLGVLLGVNLLALGMLGEYLVRIYDEVRRRPLYTIQEEWPEPEQRCDPREYKSQGSESDLSKETDGMTVGGTGSLSREDGREARS
ncbi:MAG: glycosyltransferase family 2 protein [Bacillota bacterium]|nr:glycosyltransferase family 2 protein [Bacillota bacterium]MDW7677481.1 glycosyltransferase family 2 protein [Bacillota bacterium]